jgi:hypothetical protein
MNNIEVVENAIALVKVRMQAIPEFDLYKSILSQLEYLLSVLTGIQPDRSRLVKIIVGHYAVHEFEETDPELSKALKKCQKIVFDMS